VSVKYIIALDLAMQQYQALLQGLPTSVEIPLELALLYQAKGDRAQAAVLFERAQHLDPKNLLPPAFLGKLYEQAGQRQQAIAAYRTSLNLQPDNASVLNNLAYLLADTAPVADTAPDLDEALKLGRKALQQEPENSWFADTVGWIYLKKGNSDTALQMFQAVTAKVPANPTFRLHLATALFQQGDSERAQKELKAALEVNPSTPEKERIQMLLTQISSSKRKP
jgi:Tfp pilus assembly protein PilF